MAYTFTQPTGYLWQRQPFSQPSNNTNYYITINQPAPAPTPVTPTFDPKIEANALYGKPMALFAGGFARIGASPAPIVGPYIDSNLASFIVSFGVPANPDGDRKIYAIYLDNELAWSAPSGGTSHLDGTFLAEHFDFEFRPGRYDQTVCSLDEERFPGDGNAYRPQMLLQISLLPIARFMANTGKPIPYVACDIGDVTDGADPQDGINLGTALERIAHSPWAGYTSDTFEAVDITDVVPAILIRDNFTIVDLCRSVTRIYRNIDLLQSDKLRIKDRGSNVVPDFVFDRDSIIGGENAVQIVRAGATAQRRELELIAIDPDQDYTAVPSLSQIPRNPFVISAAVGKETVTSPLVMDASTRQALVTYAQQHEENARKKVSLRVSAYGFQIEPGDTFALPDTVADGIDGEVFKCTQTEHGANYETQIEGEAILRCRVYGTESDPGIVYTYPLEDADSGGWAGLTFAHVIDAGNFEPSTSSLYARITLKFATLSAGAVMSACYFGTQAAVGDQIDFSGDQVQVFFNGIGSITGDGGTLVYVSDWFLLGTAYDDEQNYVFAAQFDAGGTIIFGRTLSAAVGDRTEFKIGADAATTDKTGYTFDNQNTAQLISLIEVADIPS